MILYGYSWGTIMVMSNKIQSWLRTTGCKCYCWIVTRHKSCDPDFLHWSLWTQMKHRIIQCELMNEWMNSWADTSQPFSTHLMRRTDLHHYFKRTVYSIGLWCGVAYCTHMLFFDLSDKSIPPLSFSLHHLSANEDVHLSLPRTHSLLPPRPPFSLLMLSVFVSPRVRGYADIAGYREPAVKQASPRC